MKKILIIIFSFGTLGLMSPFSLAEESNLMTYPVQGIFLSKSAPNKSNTSPNFGFNFMSNEFKTLIKEKQISFFIPEFIKTYQKNFTNFTSELTDKNKYKTIVSYISIPRASKYIDKKPNGDEIYLPLTTGLTFVNLLTGETLYSTTETIYGEKLYDDNYEKISAHYLESYQKTLSSVIEKAKQNFHPFEIPVAIVDNYRNLYVLNKGSEIGISEDDLLFDSMGNQLSVIYSTLGYSVAKTIFPDSNIKINSQFIKQSNNGGINQIKKPKVLLINDIGNDSIYDLLVSNLGQDSKINLITTNPTFNEMRKTVIDLNPNFKSSNIVPKNLPEYFLVFSFTPPVKTTFKQNQSGLDSSYYQMFACGTMFDKTGKIGFSQCANNSTEPRFSNKQYGTSESDMISILYKNLIENISEQINNRIEFKEYTFKIKKIEGNDIILEDKSQILSESNTITIFKKHKSDGVEYLLPEFKYNVITVNNGLATCSFDYPYTDDIEKPSKSDIAKSSMIVSSGGTNFYKTNISQTALQDSEVTIKDFDKFATQMIGTNFKNPLTLDSNIITTKTDNINETLMFKDKLNIHDGASNLSIIPYYSAKLKKHKVKGYTKIDTYKLIVGIKISDKGKIISEKSLTQDFTITLPLKNEKPTLQIELLKVIYPTLQQLVNSLK